MSYNEDFKKVLLTEPHAILGKNGITEEFIQHINILLKRYKIIKVKALKSIATKKTMEEIAAQVSKATNSKLLDIRGFKFIISQDPNKNKFT
ncbi:MAG TPA: YhbY family RNA-binding protein [Candidatus Lokiarchaeia archaeon]